ncbi:AAA family ATPase [Microtetraspora niveoalba]|uniref:AAA family ATPase n=1 Tax=Microtetraspora niveoalba TaxID=46175 RepID=UPI0008332ED0|nr:DUF3696 domain-containing protein [Microtetraspora niveoalba]
MPLARFSVGNYRCFPGTQEVELRPITVILGKNNSGKSALVRAPLVFQTGIRTDSPLPLDLDQLGESAPDFLNLVHGGSPHGNVRLRLDFERVGAAPHSLSAEIQNVDEWGVQVVSRLILSAGSESTDVEWLDWLDQQEEPGLRDPADGYSYVVPGMADAQGPAVATLPFRGLLPAVRYDDDLELVHDGPDRQAVACSDEPDLHGLVAAMAVIRAEFDDIRYLGPFRQRPRRVHRLRSRASSVVGSGGELTMDILAHDSLRRGGALTSKINEYLAANLPGWKLAVRDHDQGVYTAVLRSTGNSGLEVNLADAGAGVTQLLPILTQRAVDAVTPPRRPTLEIIEEPELHLHPSAHALLADLFLGAIGESQVRFLIETHSETFLLRLRRRIAEGAVDHEDVAVYFVENTDGAANARRIRIDSLGNLDYWPRGVFAEDFEETRALASAQFGRSEADAS